MPKIMGSGFLCIALLTYPAMGDEQVTQGRDLYLTHCAACHGSDGKGGAQKGTDQIKPADLTKIAQRRDGVWPMLEVMSIIDGYTKATKPREGMPVVAELNEGPQTVFDSGNGRGLAVPERLVAVATYLETIQSPKPRRSVP